MNIISSAFLIYLITVMITPGPNNLTMFYLGTHYGLKGTRKFLTASTVSLFVKALICGGLYLILNDVLPGAMVYLKWIGAVYLVYLAVMMVVNGFREAKEEEAGGGKEPEGSTYLSGVLLQVLNMKSWIACLTMFGVYVIPKNTSFSSIILAAFMMILMMLVSSLLWGLFGGALHTFCTKHRRLFGILCGLSLIYCAVTAVL